MNGTQEKQRSEFVLNVTVPTGIKKKRSKIKFCECGCGGMVTWHKKKKIWNKYIHGHNKSTLGIPCTEENKILLSKKLKGRFVGILHPMYGKHHSEATKKHWSNVRKGRPSFRKGIKHTELTKTKMKEKRKFQVFTNEAKIKMSVAQKQIWKSDPLRRKKQSERMRNENHFNWQGGISRHPYSLNWTDTLKESVRQRDGYKCQLCCVSQKELNERLNIHHIDYDKENCDPKNLISLCRSCHIKTNYQREKWISFFLGRQRIEGREI